MKTARERIMALRIDDILGQEAVTISANATMGEAAEILLQGDISGAPVVDEMGFCIGILSIKDLAERGRIRNQGELHELRGDDFTVVPSQGSGSLHIEWTNEDSVRKHMHPAVQTVTKQTPLLEAASILCYQHIHRLVVLDEVSHPVGVVGSLDLLKAIVDELKQ